MKKNWVHVFYTVVLITVLLCFEPFFQPVKAAQLYSDDFDDGNAAGWTQQLGGWAVTSGEYCVSVGVVENGISTVNGLSFADCAIETQLRFSDSVGFRGGIVFRYTDNQHYYSLEISNEYDKIDLIKYSPADPEYGDLIAENVILFNANVNYSLRLEAVGSNFSAYLDGQNVLSGTDNSYSSGLVGLRARRADAHFDNFTVDGDVQSISSTPVPSPTPPIQPVQQFNDTFSDDFSADSGAWQYLGSAYRDQTNQYLVLTDSDNSEGGAAFFNAAIPGSFTANFSFRGGGGDGFTIFFYKQKYSPIGEGGSLGFSLSYNAVPGYGIEFDAWQNIPGDFKQVAGGQPNPPGDPSDSHIALIGDYVGNHLAYVNDQRVTDNNWHNASVEVQASSVRVFVDQGLVLQWNGVLNRTYDGFGFSGANGDVSDWHVIDDFSISTQNLQKSSLTTTCRGSASASRFSAQINGNLTFNGTAVSGVPIFLSYSVTGGKSWQDLTLVYTGSDGSYSALWLPSVTGNYMIKAVYEGNGSYLGAINIVNFAIEPYTEESVFSVTTNSTLSELSFNSTSKELSFSVSGDNGTTGYVDVYIPKSLINDITGLKVYLDSSQIEYNPQSQSDFWLLYFTYHHSTHSVMISLGSSNANPSDSPTQQPTLEPAQSATPTVNPIIDGADPLPYIIGMIATIIVAIAVVGLAVYFVKFRKEMAK